ncbi:hypothetical protein F4212_15160 [Candidatus Poribacteria bacterium]|nr:hypothetical protein [Candidatus Poribacteria bacterium]
MRKFIVVVPLFFIVGLILIGAKPTTEKPKPQEIKLKGNILCLAEEMKTLYNVELDAEHKHLYGFKTDKDKYFTLLHTSLSKALFVDKRLHEKDLIINGRVFPNSQLLEVLSFMSVRDGVVHELYYYCDTCFIRTVAPGNCDCCQAPVVLMERPLNTDSLVPSP